jgi:hypothetical protein
MQPPPPLPLLLVPCRREVPAYVLPGQGPQVGRRVDPSPADGMSVLRRLQADLRRKAGTGVPVPVAVHDAYLLDR